MAVVIIIKNHRVMRWNILSNKQKPLARCVSAHNYPDTN